MLDILLVWKLEEYMGKEVGEMNSLASLAIGLMACAASFHSRCTGDLVKIAQLKIGRQTINFWVKFMALS